MEILAYGKEWGEYILPLILIGGITLLLLVVFAFGLYSAIVEKNIKTNLAPLIIVGLLITGLMIGFTYSLNQGVTEYWKVTITDFNEVYDQGYEIESQEGSIYKIVKKDGE